MKNETQRDQAIRLKTKGSDLGEVDVQAVDAPLKAWRSRIRGGAGGGIKCLLATFKPKRIKRK